MHPHVRAESEKTSTSANPSTRAQEVWKQYQQLVAQGAKADINTLDLMKNTVCTRAYVARPSSLCAPPPPHPTLSPQLHSMCQEYCDTVADLMVASDHARVTAGLHKALMNLSEQSNEQIRAFITMHKAGEVCHPVPISPLHHPLNPLSTHCRPQGAGLVKSAVESEGYDFTQMVAGSATDAQEFAAAVERFLQAEQERRHATLQLLKHAHAVEGTGLEEERRRLTPVELRGAEKQERRMDEEKAACVQEVLQLVEARIGALKAHAFVEELTPAEVVTGAVPRTTKSGRAITQRVLPVWEGTILVRDELKEQRALISSIRRHLIDSYNKLCREHVHRIGPASDNFKIDASAGQSMLEEVLRRYRSSLTALKQLHIYEADRIAPLRPEIINEVSLPQQLSEHSNHTDDVVLGCYMEVDLTLPISERSSISPQTAGVGLSYFQPLSIVSSYRGIGFNLQSFCQQADLVEVGGGPSGGGRGDRMAGRRRHLNQSGSSEVLRREAARRDPEVARVFTKCVERIVERGAASSAWDQVYQVAEMAYMKCFLWPTAELNNILLTVTATMAEKKGGLHLAPVVFNSVRQFDNLLEHVRQDVGAMGYRVSKNSREEMRMLRKKHARGGTFHPHLAAHPVLLYADSGVDDEFMGLYMRSKPWNLKENSLSDTEEVLKLFDDEKAYLEARWERSIGVKRGEEALYFHVPRNVVLAVSPGDVPEMAARWEERLNNLTNSQHTYEAMFLVIYQEILRESAAAGERGAKAINQYTLKKAVESLTRRMESYNVTPNANTYSTMLAICRRYPQELAELEKRTLDKMKTGGKELWWQWFEEL